MKKRLSLFLCAALALLCCAAYAGEVQEIGSIDVNGSYVLTVKLPKGYTLNMTTNEETRLMGVLTSGDEAMPTMYCSIVFDETYSEVDRMNDMTEEDLAFLESTFPEGSDISYGETTEGTLLLVVRSVDAGQECMTVLTVYKGYMIEFDLFAGAGGNLTEEQQNMAFAFLSDMMFIPAGAQ